MNWFTQFIRPKIRSFSTKSDLPENLWHKCSGCAQMVFHQDLKDFLFVCRHCGHHMRWTPAERLLHLFDEGTYQLIDFPTLTTDPLHFRDQKRYTDRLKEARHKTKLSEAVLLGQGTVSGFPVVAYAFHFEFIGGSMGMAVGQALLTAASKAIEQNACLVTIPASGGARMQEGILSLMQMPRSVLALKQVREEGLPIVTLLTNPTTGGVAASFASLGDFTWAEPGAIIGFTGARIIQETLRQPLPPGFQTAEFQRDHGFIDLIVPRADFRSTLTTVLTILKGSKRSMGRTHLQN